MTKWGLEVVDKVVGHDLKTITTSVQEAALKIFSGVF